MKNKQPRSAITDKGLHDGGTKDISETKRLDQWQKGEFGQKG